MRLVPNRTLLDRLSIRVTVLIGFGLTLGIWILAGYDFARRISDTRIRAEAITDRYMNAQERFSTIRNQVLLGSVYVRDALLDPTPEPAAAEYRQQVESTYATANQALREYVPILDSPTERDRLLQLQKEIDDFHDTMLQVLATDSSRWRSDARTLLQTHIVPKREVVIRVSEEAQALNRGAFVQQQVDIAEIYAASQRRFVLSLSLALAASMGVALVAVLSAGRLENRLRRQRVLDEQSARDLQDLSARLITVQEEERRRIARELHDEVGQSLMAIRVELAVAQSAIEAAGIDVHTLSDVRSITEGALATIRDLSHVLHPALLDDLGLVAAIEWYVREFGRRYGIRMQVVHINLTERLTLEVESSVYRIVQEALTNVAKHARAASCRITLQRLTETILVTIEDDGVGFGQTATDPSDPARGLGLISIRERATQLRGTVQLESAAGRGTRLVVELPTRARGAAEGPISTTFPGTSVRPEFHG